MKTADKSKPERERPDWNKLLKEAIEVPGRLSEAYRVFHNYSLGNRILAAIQLAERNLPLSPIASFNRWRELGRHVRKGEKAIALYMPITVRRKAEQSETSEKDEGANQQGGSMTFFMLKRNWFALAQTEGEANQPQASTPEWDADLALQTLGIKEVPFEMLNGNCQGYAKHGVMEIAINPLAVLPMKTRFHEIAHHLLGHTGQDDEVGVMADGLNLPKCIREAEAEATAYLCCATLGLPGMEESRGYIQSWLDGEKFPDKSARRVFTAADKILRAGAPASKDAEAGHE